MPRLIVINGPPAAGKSTLARRWVDEHPLALDLDVDHVRELLGGWRGDPQSAGSAAREIAVAAASTHLAAGHDVVVPQLLARPEFPDRLAEVAGDGYVEVTLMIDRDECLRRYTERWRAGADLVHGWAPAPDEAKVAALYDRVVAFTATRPHAISVPADVPAVEVWSRLRDILR